MREDGAGSSQNKKSPGDSGHRPAQRIEADLEDGPRGKQEDGSTKDTEDMESTESTKGAPDTKGMGVHEAHGGYGGHEEHAMHETPGGHGEHRENRENRENREHKGHHRMMMEDFRRRLIVSLILTVPVLALSSHIQDLLGFSLRFPGDSTLLFILSSAVYLYGGRPFILGMADELSRHRPGMMTLVSVAITVAYVYSAAVTFGLRGAVFFWELVTLIDIMLLGHWIEMRSVAGASFALEELARIMPSEAHLMIEGGTRDVRVEDLQPGDRVLIKPGEKIPVDGRVIEGETDVNEAMLTGESRPVLKAPGDEVIGGSINGRGSIVAEVSKVGAETYLAQVMDLVRRAQESKSRTQDLADRAAFVLVVVALAVGSITLAAWIYIGQDFAFAVERAVTVMVIACPHALGLAIPLVVAVSTSLAAKSGLLIRDRQGFEAARGVQAVVFDKTGTLTEGRFGVTDVIALGADEAEVLRLSASLESRAEHPLAAAIVHGARERDISPSPVERFNIITGEGIEGEVGGRRLSIVSPGYLRERGIAIDERVEGTLRQGKTVVVLLEEGRTLGALALSDVVREESREAISVLRSMGIKTMMLTGDNRFVAEAVSRDLDLDEFYAEVLPHEKAQAVARIQERFTVAMVGDGVNDAPALAQADVGIAIGAGTDVAIETADIVLVRNDPRDVARIISLSRRTYSKMFQNLLWATGYNVVAIPLAAGILYGEGILLSPAAGAVLMSLSTVIVAVNARLLSRG